MIGARVRPHYWSPLFPHRALPASWVLRCIGIMFMLLAACNLAGLIMQARTPLPTDYSEGLVVSAIMELGRNPAPAIAYRPDPTFYGAPHMAYPPVFPYTAALLARISAPLTGGAGPGDLRPALYAARGLSLLSLLLSAWFVYRLGRLWSPARTGPAVAASLFFCFLPTLVWGAWARVDALGLALTLAGLYLACRAELSRTPRAFWALAGAALLLWVLAWCTKQSFVAAPLAGGLYLLWARRWRRALSVAALGGLLGGLALGGLAVTTGGHYLSVITMERFTALSALHLLMVWGPFLVLNAPLILVAFRHSARLARTGAPPLRLLVCWGGGSLLMSLTAAKLGSADYYLFETQAYLSFVVGHWWATAGARPRWGALLGAQALLFLMQAGGCAYVLPAFAPQLAPQQAAARYITEHVAPGRPVFSESLAPLLATGRADQVFDQFLFRQLVAAGQLDGQALVRDVTERRFALLLLNFDVLHVRADPVTAGAAPWPAGFEDAVRAHYRLADTISESGTVLYAWILVPKAGP